MNINQVHTKRKYTSDTSMNLIFNRLKKIRYFVIYASNTNMNLVHYRFRSYKRIEINTLLFTSNISPNLILNRFRSYEQNRDKRLFITYTSNRYFDPRPQQVQILRNNGIKYPSFDYRFKQRPHCIDTSNATLKRVLDRFRSYKRIEINALQLLILQTHPLISSSSKRQFEQIL